MRRKHWLRKSGLGLGLGVGGGGVGYFVNDQFLTNVAVDHVDGSLATPLGTRAVADPNHYVSVIGGQGLNFNTPVANNQFYSLDAQARTAGLLFFFKTSAVPVAGTAWLGIQTVAKTQPSYPTYIVTSKTYRNNTTQIVTCGTTPDWICIVMRYFGNFMFGKISGKWRLLNVDVDRNDATLYAGVGAYNTGASQVIAAKINSPIYYFAPEPLASDTFMREGTGDATINGKITASCYDATGNLYAGFTDGTIKKSTDDGQTWGAALKTISISGTQGYFNGYQCMFVDSRGYIYASPWNPVNGADSGLWRSADAGATWVLVLPTTSRIWGIDEDGLNNIYAGEYGPAKCIYKSANGDLGSWATVYTAPAGQDHIHNVCCDKTTNNVCAAIGDGATSQIAVYEQATDTWTTVNTPGGAKQFVGIANIPGVCWLFGTDANDLIIWRCTDALPTAGSTFTKVYSPILHTPPKNVLTAYLTSYSMRVDPDTGYIYSFNESNSTQAGVCTVVGSNDLGATWRMMRAYPKNAVSSGFIYSSNIYGSKVAVSYTPSKTGLTTNGLLFDLSTPLVGTTNGLGHMEGFMNNYGIEEMYSLNTVGSGGSGLSWTAQIGTWEVFGNKISASALDGGVAIATVDTGKADIYGLCDLTVAGGQGGNVWRYIDANNYLYSYHDGTNFALIQVKGGIEANIVAPTAKAYVADATAHVRLIGTEAYVYYNKVLVGTGTVDAIFASATAHGLRTTDVGNFFTDFCVYEEPGATTDPYSVLNMFSIY